MTKPRFKNHVKRLPYPERRKRALQYIRVLIHQFDLQDEIAGAAPSPLSKEDTKMLTELLG